MPIKFQSKPPKLEGEISSPAHNPIPSIEHDHAHSTSCYRYDEVPAPLPTEPPKLVQSLSSHKYGFIAVGRKIFESFLKIFFAAAKSKTACRSRPFLSWAYLFRSAFIAIFAPCSFPSSQTASIGNPRGLIRSARTKRMIPFFTE